MSTSKEYDPYQAPTASLDGPAASGAGAEAVPGTIVALLAETRPWVKLMGVLVFVGLVLGGVGALVGFLAAGREAGGTPAAAFAMIPLFLLMLLYIPPGLHLLRYAASIRQLEQGAGQAALTEALGHQKSFWKFVGILALVMMSFYALMVVVGIAAGLLGAAARNG